MLFFVVMRPLPRSDRNASSCQATTVSAFRGNAHLSRHQRIHRRLENLDRNAKVHQGAKNHVSARPANTVETEDLHASRPNSHIVGRRRRRSTTETLRHREDMHTESLT